MDHSKASPLPWEIKGYSLDSDCVISIAHDIKQRPEGGYMATWICEVDGDGCGDITPEMEANAALLVKAVNSYEPNQAEIKRLREAVKHALHYMAHKGDDLDELRDEKAEKIFNAALNKDGDK